MNSTYDAQHFDLEVTESYNNNSNLTMDVTEQPLNLDKPAHILFKICICVSLLACVATIIAYIKSYSRKQTTTRRTEWGSRMTWIFANFVVSFVIRDLMVLSLFVIPVKKIKRMDLYSTFYMYTTLPNFFWMFIEAFFLYLSASHYDGLYNKLNRLHYKKITIFTFCWLIPVVLVTVWATYKIQVGGSFIVLDDMIGWVCIVGPIYLILAINFVMMVRVLCSRIRKCWIDQQHKRKYNNRETNNYKWRERPMDTTDDHICSRIRKFWKDKRNKCMYSNGKNNNYKRRETHTNTTDSCEGPDWTRVFLKLAVVTVILSALFGLTNMIAIVIHRTEARNQVNEIVALINGVMSFLQGFFVAIIFAWTNKEIMHFAEAGMSRRESRRRQTESDLETDLNRRKSSNTNTTRYATSWKKSEIDCRNDPRKMSNNSLSSYATSSKRSSASSGYRSGSLDSNIDSIGIPLTCLYLDDIVEENDSDINTDTKISSV